MVNSGPPIEPAGCPSVKPSRVNDFEGPFCGPVAPSFPGSGEDRPDDVAVDVGEAEVAALELESELLVVDA